MNTVLFLMPDHRGLFRRLDDGYLFLRHDETSPKIYTGRLITQLLALNGQQLIFNSPNAFVYFIYCQNPLFLQVVDAGGSLWIQFIDYNNPSGEGSNGHCCDGRGVACQSDGCDHYFEICVTNR